ncbi:MAG TPA: PaaI family thioesterase [Acidisarcina sp.]|nr:PaaI family thioesterase [Acidisarcina sp.]
MKSKLTPLSHGAQNHCFGCGDANKTGLRLKFLTDETGRVLSRIKIPRRFEGPPGYMHGGAIATLLDEAMSKANRARGVTAMTRQMEVEYLRPVPLGVPLLLEGRLLRADGRKHYCEAEVSDADGRPLARGKGLFLAIDPEKFRQQKNLVES